MSDSPFYNPSQAGVDEKIKAAISSLKSELQSFISTEVAKATSSNNQQPAQPNKSIVTNKNQKEGGTENLEPRESPQFNYIIDICLNGERSKMAIAGQVLTQEEIDAL